MAERPAAAETPAEHIDPALKAAGWGVVEGSRIMLNVATSAVKNFIRFQIPWNDWNTPKSRLKVEGSESVTKGHRLKLPAADGKSLNSMGRKGT